MGIENPEDIKAPRLSNSAIRKKADDFRLKYWPVNTAPIDILHIAEFDLALEFVPVNDLKRDFDIDALLFNGQKSIAVDNDEYLNDSFLNRIRFSVAHELGHIVLHSDIYKDLKFDNLDDWFSFVAKIPETEYSFIEYQAYEFAGRLLVPADVLRIEILNFSNEIKKAKESLGDMNGDILIDYLTPKICKKFEVSPQVIKLRINKEGFSDLINN